MVKKTIHITPVHYDRIVIDFVKLTATMLNGESPIVTFSLDEHERASVLTIEKLQGVIELSP